MTEQTGSAIGNFQQDPNRGHELALQELESFIANPGFSNLAQLFGESRLPSEPADRLVTLSEIAATHWDFRRGAERQATDWDIAELDDPDSDVWKIIFDSATGLNMVHSTVPTITEPSYLAILGGANKAPYDRLRYGLGVVNDPGQIVYLGSSRPVSDAERAKALDYAPGAQTEFDLGCGAIETLLGAQRVDEVSEVRNGDVWGVRYYEYERDGKTRVAFALSTPQIIGAHRATTHDNYAFFANRAELTANPEETVVAVTTGLYVPGQHLPAVQQLTLPHGIRVETVGHDANYSGVVRKPAQLLQEIKTAIDRARELAAALKY